MTNRRIFNWQCRDRAFELGRRTYVMGILNVTPDSFSDGGIFVKPDAAIDRALEMVELGADIIDIGGESTRPGAMAVPVKEELRRTIPIIAKIREHSTIPLSIDTMKAAVAEDAIAAGADIINDVSAFEADSRMAEVAVKYQAGVILMHMKGTPRNMQDNPFYEDVVHEVRDHLRARIEVVARHGVAHERIVIDPGIGFGKTMEHNLELLRRLPELEECACPVMVGASRKRFIGAITGRDQPSARLAGSLGVAAWAIMHGAYILRVHDVIDTCDICRVLDIFIQGES